METKNCVMQDQYNRIQGAKLKVQNKKFSIYKGVNIIGRNKSAAVDLKHLNVSQNHAIIIIVDDSQHFISDLNSSNGTYLFGSKITPFKLYDLPNDTEIKFGDISGVYLKMSNKNATVHLETESIELTQNLTQTFYGATTQLMVDDSILHQTVPNLSPQNTPTMETQDIHETNTQIVQYPPTINNENIQVDKNSSSTEEISDIHNAPTQIFMLPQQPSTSKTSDEDIHEAATQLAIFPQKISVSSNPEENIHEIATQVVSYLPENIHSNSQKQDKSNVIPNSNVTSIINDKNTNVSINQDSLIEETVIEETIMEDLQNEVMEEVRSAVTEEVQTEVSTEIVQMNINENSNDSVDLMSINRPPDTEIQRNDKAICSSNSNIDMKGKSPKKIDDKSTASEDLLQSQNDKAICSSNSDTDIEEKPVKRKARKLNSSESLLQSQNNKAVCSSDSDTDIEEKPTKRKARKLSSSQSLLQSQNDKPICSSDSETDIEDVDIVKLQKKSLRKLKSSQSDTDTKTSNVNSEHNSKNIQKCTNQMKIINSDSETDVEDNRDLDITLTQNDEVIKPKILSKKVNFNSDSETDVEDNKETEAVMQAAEDEDNASMEILNETDCIPATQDAFANMFQYSAKSLNSNRSENVSSEESFKLGLTELMIDENDTAGEQITKKSEENSLVFNKNASQLNDKPIAEEKMATPPQELNGKESDAKNTNLSDNNEEVVEEDVYMITTQKIDDDLSRKQKENMSLVHGQDSEAKSCLITSKMSSKPEETDVYLMPTQPINQIRDSMGVNMDIDQEKEADEDFYMMPTQKIRKDQVLNKEKDSLYSMATQDINPLTNAPSTSKSIYDKDGDDLYMMPTQVINESKISNSQKEKTRKVVVDNEQEVDDNLYLLPTQKINEARATSKAPHKFTFKKLVTNLDGSLTTILGNKPEGEPNSHTQKVSEIADNKCNQIDKQRCNSSEEKIEIEGPVEDDPYLRPTQEINIVSLSKETEPEDVPYLAAKQPIHQDSLDENKDVKEVRGGKIYVLETQTKLFMSANKSSHGEASSIQNSTSDKVETVAYDKQPLTHTTKESGSALIEPMSVITYQLSQDNKLTNAKKEDSSLKRVADTSPDVTSPKMKRVKKSDIENLKRTIIESNKLDDAETLSQIEAFVKKPFDNANITPVENLKENYSTQESETLSQIEAFVKKPFESANVTSMKNLKESNDSTQESETLSQISAFIKKPLDKIVPIANKNKNVSLFSEEDEDRVETLSQIERFIKQPVLPKKKQLSNIETDRAETLSQIEHFIKQPLVPKRKQLSNIESDQAETLSQIEHVLEQPSAPNSKQLSNTKNDHPSITEKVLIHCSKPSQSNKDNKGVDSKIKKNLTKTKPKPSIIIEEAEQVRSDSIKPIDQNKKKFESDESDDEKSDTRNDKNSGRLTSHQDTVKSDIDQSFALLEAKSTKTRKSRRITNTSEIKVAVPKNRRSMATSSIAELTEKEGVGKKATRRSRRVQNNNIEPVCTETKVKMQKSECSDSDFSESETPAKVMKINVSRQNKENSSSNDPPPLSSTRRGTGRKAVSNIENKSTPSTSKMRVSTRMKTQSNNSAESSSCDGDSVGSNDFILATPSRRGRSTASNDTTLTMSDRSKRKLRPKVVFTMLDSPKLESLIRQLGGSIVDTVDSSTVLVTEHVKRSQKLLAAVGQGKPICSPSWIYASKKANEFLDPWDFILIDKEAESKWDFSLKDSITKATTEKLLTNYTFQLMVSNAADVLKGAIEACGGKCVKTTPKNVDGFLVVVASPENKNKYLKIKKQSPGMTVVEPEAIFDGVLRQELRLGRHLLT